MRSTLKIIWYPHLDSSSTTKNCRHPQLAHLVIFFHPKTPKQPIVWKLVVKISGPLTLLITLMIFIWITSVGANMDPWQSHWTDKCFSMTQHTSPDSAKFNLTSMSLVLNSYKKPYQLDYQMELLFSMTFTRAVPWENYASIKKEWLLNKHRTIS